MSFKTESEYIAFISYRHAVPDTPVARRVQSMIEQFPVDGAFRDRFPSGRFGKVFRDVEDLAASNSLTDEIRRALDHSAYLIVICTTQTPDSIWVEAEVDYFLTHHDKKNVFTVLVEGTPQTSFPRALLQKDLDGEADVLSPHDMPLAANLTKGSHTLPRFALRKEITRICAAILGCPFDALWQREKRRRNRTVATASAVLCAAILLFVFGWRGQIKQIARQEEEISRQSEQISAQEQAIRKKEREELLSAGRQFLENGEREKAIETARALTEEGAEKDEIYYAALSLLQETMGAYDVMNRFRAEALIRQETDIDEILISEDGTRVFTADEDNTIRCFSTKDGALLWEAARPADAPDGTSSLYCNQQQMFEIPAERMLLVSDETMYRALSVADGREFYRHIRAFPNNLMFLSPEKDRAVMVEAFTNEELVGETEWTDLVAYLVSVKSGEALSYGVLSTNRELLGDTDFATPGGVFSEDGSRCFFVFRTNARPEATEEWLNVFSWDFSDEELHHIKSLPLAQSEQRTRSRPFYGLTYVEETDTLLLSYERTGNIVMSALRTDGEELQRNGAKIALSPDRKDVHYSEGTTYVAVSVNDMLYLYDMEGKPYETRQFSVNVVGLYFPYDDRKQPAFLRADGHGAWIRGIEKNAETGASQIDVVSNQHGFYKTDTMIAQMSHTVPFLPLTDDGAKPVAAAVMEGSPRQARILRLHMTNRMERIAALDAYPLAIAASKDGARALCVGAGEYGDRYAVWDAGTNEIMPADATELTAGEWIMIDHSPGALPEECDAWEGGVDSDTMYACDLDGVYLAAWTATGSLSVTDIKTKETVYETEVANSLTQLLGAPGGVAMERYGRLALQTDEAREMLFLTVDRYVIGVKLLEGGGVELFRAENAFCYLPAADGMLCTCLDHYLAEPGCVFVPVADEETLRKN